MELIFLLGEVTRESCRLRVLISSLISFLNFNTVLIRVLTVSSKSNRFNYAGFDNLRCRVSRYSLYSMSWESQKWGRFAIFDLILASLLWILSKYLAPFSKLWMLDLLVLEFWDSWKLWFGLILSWKTDRSAVSVPAISQYVSFSFIFSGDNSVGFRVMSSVCFGRIWKRWWISFKVFQGWNRKCAYCIYRAKRRWAWIFCTKGRNSLQSTLRVIKKSIWRKWCMWFYYILVSELGLIAHARFEGLPWRRWWPRDVRSDLCSVEG